MAKSYTKQLTEWVRQRSHSSRHARYRIAFLAVKDDVREALDQGWPVKTIWAHMVEQQRIGFGYDTFLAYVKSQLRPAADQPAVGGSDGLPARSLAPDDLPPCHSKGSGSPGQTGQEPHRQEQMPGFTFKAAPNREELI